MVFMNWIKMHCPFQCARRREKKVHLTIHVCCVVNLWRMVSELAASVEPVSVLWGTWLAPVGITEGNGRLKNNAVIFLQNIHNNRPYLAERVRFHLRIQRRCSPVFIAVLYVVENVTLNTYDRYR